MLLFNLIAILLLLIVLRSVANAEKYSLMMHESSHRTNWLVRSEYKEGHGNHLYCYGLYKQYRDELVAKGEPYSYCIDQAYKKMIKTLEYNKLKDGELFHPFHGHLTLLSEILLKRVSFVA